jgi:hypothetical protein
MKVLWVSCLCALLSGCGTPHAARVRCDTHLVPINAPASPVTNPVASAGQPKQPKQKGQSMAGGSLASTQGAERSIAP